MPMYEYECDSCKKSFEKLVRSMDKSQEKADCPECGSKKTRRKLSVFAAVGATGKESAPANAPGCGRCGGPGPCAFGE
jgi:putative FmdB family regulatory protein